jgi:hypothetical protein
VTTDRERFVRSTSKRSFTSKTSWRSRDRADSGWLDLTEPAGQTVFGLPRSQGPEMPTNAGIQCRAHDDAASAESIRVFVPASEVAGTSRRREQSRGTARCPGTCTSKRNQKPMEEEDSQQARGNAGLESGPPLGATPWSRANTSRGARERQEGPRSR